ncbi:MAG: cytochrome c oxidase assembly protein, partial [Pseudomonadota bacterium]|nr:cytochrome c oxidase assembly protein [Pseudomonadota bacterium]
IANRNDNLPWGFSPEQEEIKLTVGERNQTHFSVNNSYDRAVVAQAIPSVSPPQAADYLNKIECFCFQRQPLAAGEAKQFPLVFFIDPALPEEINKLTLSYTLFDISERDASGVD